MNGIISVPTSRVSPSFKQVSAAVAGGVCLFVGFAVGSQVVPVNNKTQPLTQKLLPSQEIDFSKISWISQEISSKKVGFQSISTQESLNVDGSFTPYVLPVVKPVAHQPKPALTKKKFVQKIKHLLPTVRSQARLEKKNSIEQTKQDFQAALIEMRQKFFATIYLKPVSNNEMLAMSLQPNSGEETSSVSLVAASAEFKAVPPKTLAHPVVAKKHKDVYHSILSVQKIQKPKASEIEASSPKVEVKEEAVVVAPILAPVITEYAQGTKLNTPGNTGVSIQMEAASAEQNAPTLTTDQKANLKDALLNEQIKAISAQNKLATPTRIATNTHINPVVSNKVSHPGPEAAPESAPLPRNDFVAPKANPQNAISCDVLSNHLFFRPGVFEASQICPTQKEWISSPTLGLAKTSGWVKLTTPDNLPTLTLHPAPAGGATLLLDNNSIAALALASGVHIAKGAGIVAGEVPAGYKVDFLGRGEEAQYFELNGKKYFAFLNAEPGAGVVELVSDQNQNAGSTVFMPVLQDTITYLDLSKPETRNIFVQVVKNGQPDDQEVVGLTVSVSAHKGIQAITQSQGRAILKNVNIVAGFPVFIDVSSKYGNEQSYTYRYELRHMNSAGIYQVAQVAEKSIAKWVKQIPQGLSDQSGMILGYVDRHELDGFKNSYYERTIPLSEKFGLEPLNFSILWDGNISGTEPLEGDKPRFMSVQVPEGITQVKLINEYNQEIYTNVVPVSPRVINVISE